MNSIEVFVNDLVNDVVNNIDGGMLDTQKLDAMKYGMFNNRSYEGLKSSVLKSGVCKYYRRGVFAKFEWCIIEMMIFGLKNKGLMTNIINRLKILIFEEIVISEVSNIVEMIRLVEEVECSTRWNRKIELILEFVKVSSLCKRGRICSYMNNWWKYNKEVYDLGAIGLNKVLKYKKVRDSDELLKLGELLLKFIDTKDERLIDVFNKMYVLKGAMGVRDRRNDGIYLYWEIIEDLFKDNDKFMKICKFCKEMFYRKGMKERAYFAVWIGMFVINYEKLDWNKEFSNKWGEVNLEDYFKKREIIEIDDYVKKDYHVNKNYGLKKFAEEGAFVKDEYLEDLDRGELYKGFYIEKKTDQEEERVGKDKDKTKGNGKAKAKAKDKAKDKDKAKNTNPIVNTKPSNNLKKKMRKEIDGMTNNIETMKNNIETMKNNIEVMTKYISKMEGKIDTMHKLLKKTNKVEKTVVVKKEPLIIEERERELNFIDWREFDVIKVLEEGVCGGKTCCIIVKYGDKQYVLKEFKKAMNWGRDYECVDGLKGMFGLIDLNMIRIRSNYGLGKIDDTIKSFVGNWKIISRNCVYCMMAFKENLGDVGKSKQLLTDKVIAKELLKIRLFDGLFRSSDNILRNVLVGDGEYTNRLISIDEGDLFGKRATIFNKNDWSKKNMNMDMLDEVLKEIEENKTERMEIITNRLKTFGFEENVSEFTDRYDRYREIVVDELCNI